MLIGFRSMDGVKFHSFGSNRGMGGRWALNQLTGSSVLSYCDFGGSFLQYSHYFLSADSL